MASKVKLEGVMELREAVARIEAVAAGLKEGTLVFDGGDESLTLRPSRVVSAEFKAGQKKDKEKISLEISWRPAS